MFVYVHFPSEKKRKKKKEMESKNWGKYMLYFLQQKLSSKKLLKDTCGARTPTFHGRDGRGDR